MQVSLFLRLHNCFVGMSMSLWNDLCFIARPPYTSYSMLVLNPAVVDCLHEEWTAMTTETGVLLPSLTPVAQSTGERDDEMAVADACPLSQLPVSAGHPAFPKSDVQLFIFSLHNSFL